MALSNVQVAEGDLLRRALQGDSAAFGTLYESYLEPVYRYVYYRVGDSHEAEDLTETIFLKAWEALPGIRLDGFNFRAWIYRIAHNLVVDRHRTYRYSLSLSQVVHLESKNESPEAVYQKTETDLRLAEIIALLEPDLQSVILFRFILGMSHAETAKVMDRSEVHIRVLQHRAIKKVKKLLEGEAENLNGNGSSH